MSYISKPKFYTISSVTRLHLFNFFGGFKKDAVAAVKVEEDKKIDLKSKLEKVIKCMNSKSNLT